MNGGDGEAEAAAAAAGPPPPPLEWKFSQVFGERTAGEEVQEGINEYVESKVGERLPAVASVGFQSSSSARMDLLQKADVFVTLGTVNSSIYQIDSGCTIQGSVRSNFLLVDIISAIEFDKTGDHLATGDRGGRVVLFERTDTKENGGNRRDLERMDYQISRHPEFRWHPESGYKTELQSHDSEFDYLKSLEIEEKINKIRWCQTANGAVFLLSTNDKTIKFWKFSDAFVVSSDASAVVQEKKVKKISEMNVDPSKAVGNGSFSSSSISSSLKSSLSNGGYSDRSCTLLNNDLSLPPGGISSLRLPVTCTLVGCKVTSNETSLVARCRRVYAHAHDYHINSISNNRFEEQEAPGSRSFFTEIIASISDIKFGKDGRYILSRDYMTLKLWDINMDSGPVSTFQVHEYLRPKLLVENGPSLSNLRYLAIKVPRQSVSLTINVKVQGWLP
ncbi:hypothetical protein RJ640_008507 [Escallonia rubra]|uniref:Serine/threonine-protein phosphatase 2A 55 kDa regulatory subunit B n=1 Tax=Escallonia rubra TaxID=112253 RepID=A0AA88RQS5_9ASTE|nr:hypothetical protein RJ640_008507 [Escallonia rubra]